MFNIILIFLGSSLHFSNLHINVYHVFDADFEELKIIKNSAEMRKVTAHQSTKDQKLKRRHTEHLEVGF